MTMHNPENERIKRKYFSFLREARRQSEASVDAAAMAIARFEAYTRCRAFKAFNVEQAIVVDALPDVIVESLPIVPASLRCWMAWSGLHQFALGCSM